MIIYLFILFKFARFKDQSSAKFARFKGPILCQSCPFLKADHLASFQNGQIRWQSCHIKGPIRWQSSDSRIGRRRTGVWRG